MKQFWKKIIVSTIMIAIFLAPVSGGVKINKNNNLAIKIEKKEVKAQMITGDCSSITDPCVFIEKVQINRNSAKFNIKVLNIKEKFPSENAILIRIELTGSTSESQTKTTEDMRFPIDQNMEETEIRTLCIGQTGCDDNDSTLLTENTNYTLIAYILLTQTVQTKLTFTTAVEGSGKEGSAGNLRVYQTEEDFGCDIMPPGVNIGGCILQVFFILWQASALVATLAGHFLDFFIYYATDSASYINTFVSKAWGAVRDVANIFFIIALLYVAIKTILGLNVTDNKKLISAVIIVGLIINFSLFTTKVVIDGSNILAKIFYNNITSTKADSTDAAIEAGGEKSISIGLIDKFNPQNIVMDAYKAGLGLGYAIFLTLLLMAVTLYTAYIFFSVALLFVARVVSLWISMIFSPIAFASYTVPFEIPGFGHKEWWKGLIENAFLAPLFIFFLYIIVMFTEFLTEITKYQSDPSLSDFTSTIRRLMTMIIPFIIIVMLLTKAKKLAVKLSGDMGAIINKVGAVAGGLALGAATGGAGMLASSTIGKYAQNVANNDELRRVAAEGDPNDPRAQGRAQRKLNRANYFANKSFDFRQTAAGKGLGKVTGMNFDKGLSSVGLDTKTLKGGRHAQQEREKEKGIEKMKTYEMTGAAAIKQNDRATQYKRDKEKAEKFINDNGGIFDEQDFKEIYERGENLKDRGYGLDKKVDKGSIQNTDQINKDRRYAYANALDEKAKHAVQTFFTEWAKGMKTMTTTAGGLGTTLAVGAATGGLGAGVTIVGGGFLKALKETMRVHPTDPEVIAAIRKGENPNKKLIDELKKMTEKGQGDSGKLSEIAKKMTDGDKKE